MAFQLQNQIVHPFILHELDPSGEAQVSFRQVATAAMQIRDQLVFSGQSRTLKEEGVKIERSIPWSVREEIEVRLTICDASGILKADGSPLFIFKNGTLSMNPDQFHEAWGLLPPSVASILHEKCLEANPDWDWRSNPTPAVQSDPVDSGTPSTVEEPSDE